MEWYILWGHESVDGLSTSGEVSMLEPKIRDGFRVGSTTKCKDNMVLETNVGQFESQLWMIGGYREGEEDD